jgi:2,4-dienoyl-CoA reductase-like NADH-dependent reductase (Old Yellow Enzyme family)/NADPH-dependent 2,4-dienoyl-CoA reductase/sulfur reductase-like enzyme
MSNFKNLFKPGKIGTMGLKNRLVMAPMCTKFGTEYGSVNQRLIDFYVERAKGGVGLIIIENTCIEWPRGKAGNNPIRLDDWQYVQGLADLAEAVHPYGTKIATQLQHVGRQTNVERCTSGEELISASDVPCEPSGGFVPRPLTISEIEELIDRFVKAAVRTKAAGFDAVEIHGAHGYIITQFMSPYTNKRTDRYGGNFERRMRLPVEIVKRIRASVGEEFPVIMRFSADEFVEGGYSIEDGKKIAQVLEGAGVDCLDVSAGIYESRFRMFPTLGLQPGCNLPLIEAIKNVVNVPVIGVGRFGEDLELADKVIGEGKADFISLGRSLFADAHLPKKALQNMTKDIRPCLACNEVCIGHIQRSWHVHCQVNPELGREREYRIRPAPVKKRVVIVGGGPAGMEAAMIAARRNHQVTLIEKEMSLGGQLIPASVPWFKNSLRRYLEYMAYQVRKEKIEVIMNQEATPENLRSAAPDIIILAIGGIPIRPEIPGTESEKILFAQDVFTGKHKIGEKAIIIGGGRMGCELAWYLAEQKREITILEKLEELLTDTVPINKMYLLSKLREYGVRVITGANILRFVGNKAEVNVGKEERAYSGAIILACGYEPNQNLAHALKKDATNTSVYRIGDCRSVGRNIWGATSDGAWISHHLEEQLGLGIIE